MGQVIGLPGRGLQQGQQGRLPVVLLWLPLGRTSQPEPTGQRAATALSNSSPTRPRLGQGQPLAKASIHS